MLRDSERCLCSTMICTWVGAIFAVVQECMRRDANILVHLGTIKVWNASGIRPRACDVFQQIAEAAGSCAPAWRGSGLPTAEQGIKVLSSEFSLASRSLHDGDRVNDRERVERRLTAGHRSILGVRTVLPHSRNRTSGRSFHLPRRHTR